MSKELQPLFLDIPLYERAANGADPAATTFELELVAMLLKYAPSHGLTVLHAIAIAEVMRIAGQTMLENIEARK